MTDETRPSDDRPPDGADSILGANPEAWLAAIVEYSDDAIIGKTLDSLIRSWNGGAARIFGYEAAEIVGKPVYALIPPELASRRAARSSRDCSWGPASITMRRCASEKTARGSMSR